MVDIVNDSVLEEEQTFFLVLSTADPDIAVQEDPAVVLIMDNDGIYCSSCYLTYSVSFTYQYCLLPKIEVSNYTHRTLGCDILSVH